MHQAPSVLKILKQASREIELLTGDKIVAFIVNHKDIEQDRTRSVDNLKQAICQMFDVSWPNLVIPCRKSERCLAKQLFCWYATDRLGLSLTETAKLLKKDHTTVIHGRNKIRDFLSIHDAYINEKVETLQMYLDLEPVTEVA